MDEPKDIVRRYFDEYHSGRDQSIVGEIVTHELREPTEQVRLALVTAFPDYSVEIRDQVSEGDKVATVWTARGTHEGTWDSPIGPIPATGKPVEWTGTTTARIVDGRMAEVIGSNWDHLAILQQMGAVAVTEPRSGA
jgi:predicted ester cyclase